MNLLKYVCEDLYMEVDLQIFCESHSSSKKRATEGIFVIYNKIVSRIYDSFNDVVTYCHVFMLVTNNNGFWVG